jgi:hypothetical protein
MRSTEYIHSQLIVFGRAEMGLIIARAWSFRADTNFSDKLGNGLDRAEGRNKGGTNVRFKRNEP